MRAGGCAVRWWATPRRRARCSGRSRPAPRSVKRVGAQHVHRARQRFVIRPLAGHQHYAGLHLVAHPQRQPDRTASVEQPNRLSVLQAARPAPPADAARSTARLPGRAGSPRRRTLCGSGNSRGRSAGAAGMRRPRRPAPGPAASRAVAADPCSASVSRVEFQLAGRRAEVLAAFRPDGDRPGLGQRVRIMGRHRASARRGTARAGSRAATCGIPGRSAPCGRRVPAPAAGSTRPVPAAAPRAGLYCM